jgi:hypothetical protein
MSPIEVTFSIRTCPERPFDILVTVFSTPVRRGGDGDGYNFLFPGEVAAARDNDVCGVGVAYDSLVAGILFIDLKSGSAF